MADEQTVYFELMVIGASAKLVAVDARSGVEVTVIGPANGSQEAL